MRPPRGGGFRGRSTGGRDGGGRFGGGRGRGRFGSGDRFNEGPPEQVVEVSAFVHACEGDAVTKLTNEKIPYFNAPIYLQNKTQIGKVDEIFGAINESGAKGAPRGRGAPRPWLGGIVVGSPLPVARGAPPRGRALVKSWGFGWAPLEDIVIQSTIVVEHRGGDYVIIDDVRKAIRGFDEYIRAMKIVYQGYEDVRVMQ
ncbi:putative H/ACA ribonucleoprotein complex subunit 1-like protein 1 [Tanacetum coccineum]|uniref:H/ACA ribonucleoprotein complex subunit n=1 Tax=Tanacetum coccineum TaxID=301880 RepID=A0ABQ4XJ58_9ASTR